MGFADTTLPFTQTLANSNVAPTLPATSNQTITEIDLVFSYTAPITSSTFTYTGGGSYYSGGGSGFYSGPSSSGGNYFQNFE
jgi:hypothetical protein